MKTLLRSLGLVAFAGAVIFPLRAAEEPERPAAAAPAGYVPCKISSQTTAVFPARMITEGITRGEVRIILEVGTDGQLTDALVAAFTRREFADEVLRVLSKSRFTPGLVDGQPVISIVNLTYKFESTGIVAFQRIGLPARDVEKMGDEFEYKPHGIATIDSPPSGRDLAGPIYPKKWSDEGRTGEVTVDFYIDESGRTRMPVAVGTPDEYLAAAAIAAVKEWRFETPRYHGRPALAHAQQTFTFKLDPKAPVAPDA
jgi:TonB family protein